MRWAQAKGGAYRWCLVDTGLRPSGPWSPEGGHSVDAQPPGVQEQLWAGASGHHNLIFPFWLQPSHAKSCSLLIKLSSQILLTTQL